MVAEQIFHVAGRFIQAIRRGRYQAEGLEPSPARLRHACSFWQARSKARFSTENSRFLRCGAACCSGFFAANVIGEYQKYLVYLLSVFALAQLLLAIWSHYAHWDESYFYAKRATAENESMFLQWENVAESYPPLLFTKFQDAEQRDSLIQERDRDQGITPTERRFGMRSALLRKRKKCALCRKIPSSIKPTNCDCCGNF